MAVPAEPDRLVTNRRSQTAATVKSGHCLMNPLLAPARGGLVKWFYDAYRSMKNRIIRAAILGIAIFVSFCVLAVWRSTKAIKHDEGNRQNVQDLSFILMDYKASHHHYPAGLDELTTQTSTNDERDADKILHASPLQISEYEARTNGFIFTANSPDTWLHKGDRYVAEYVESNDDSVLKINGSVFFENRIKE
jgi:hypothetical protein